MIICHCQAIFCMAICDHRSSILDFHLIAIESHAKESGVILMSDVCIARKNGLDRKVKVQIHS